MAARPAELTLGSQWCAKARVCSHVSTFSLTQWQSRSLDGVLESRLKEGDRGLDGQGGCGSCS